MLKFNVAGWTKCGAFAQAKHSLLGLSTLFPSRLSVNIQEHSTRDEYMAWLETFRDSVNLPNHTTSPLVWTDDKSFVGDRSQTLAYCRDNIGNITGATAGVQPVMPKNQVNDGFSSNHGHDYDLIVIGGGSGGLACSKEAAKRGAKVAVLDFVKPSPQGTTWGLGGTCVNVGCIPKKLMHHAALLGEHGKDAAEFGWTTAAGAAAPTHDWDTLRDNVQDHIKGLNFGYKVQLRDENVTYINKLARFVSPHQLECVDKKGRAEVISAARFVVAVGGRPTVLDIPGGEHAISSDDLFSLKTAPGKTCVLGAGYVALECAGFLTGLKQGDVTVLVRSIPLRGFDRDVVDKVTAYMTNAGTKIEIGVKPTSIEKISAGSAANTSGRDQYRVHYDNGGSDVFDTVLTAIGRRADTAGLGLAELGVTINPSNGKIVANNEQSSVPHIYAIGDVVDKTPELTPVAIMAGKMLAARLVNGTGKEPAMDYKKVATAVFTPLELGTVGLSEQEAIDTYGEANVDSYISSFTPLEMSLLHLDGNPCLAKVVIDKNSTEVLGIHIAAPNAGEIIQGYAVALRKGLKYEDLTGTVGIHPTTAEELVQLTVSKSSGESADKGGC